jgi:lipid A 4'-phosphatase
MNRTGLIIALAIAVVGGLLFGLFPGLDLAISRYFHDYTDASNHTFALRIYPPVMNARNIGLWIGTILVAPAVASLIVKFILPQRKMVVSGRAVVFLISTLVLAPGLMVNVGLKEHWNRSRPIDVRQLGGNETFVAWWDPRGDCASNCSFVSGDVAGAAWTFAPAALAPPQWRMLAYGAALVLTVGMGAVRVMAGAHFTSDVLFAAVLTFLIVWFMHALIYRWPRTRLSEDGIEKGLERAGLACRDGLTWLGHRAAAEIAGPEPAEDSEEKSKGRRRGWW